MILSAYYKGREVWRAEGPDWDFLPELEPISTGWTYALGSLGPMGREAIRLVIPRPIGERTAP